jgi:hypothetical protein
MGSALAAWVMPALSPTATAPTSEPAPFVPYAREPAAPAVVAGPALTDPPPFGLKPIPSPLGEDGLPLTEPAPASALVNCCCAWWRSPFALLVALVVLLVVSRRSSP